MSRIWLLYGSCGMEKAEAEKTKKKKKKIIKSAQISISDNLVAASHIFPTDFLFTLIHIFIKGHSCISIVV